MPLSLAHKPSTIRALVWTASAPKELTVAEKAAAEEMWGRGVPKGPAIPSASASEATTYAGVLAGTMFICIIPGLWAFLEPPAGDH